MNARNPNAQTNEKVKYMFNVESDGTIVPKIVSRGSALLEIPAAVYTLMFDAEHGIVYLKPENNFKLPKRVYGNVTTHADRFLRAYELGDKNVAALLIGDPGSGKTLTLKTVVHKAVELDMPAVLVNENFPPEVLVGFMNTVSQNMLVVFDEVDKTYAEDNANGNGQRISQNQRALLTLLDGVSTGGKKLYMFTANDYEMISRYMKDRPSRVRYTIHFERITLDIVRDFVTSNLKDKDESHLHAFVHMALCDGGSGYSEYASKGMNFDSMSEYVTEMNNFGESLTDVLKLMAPKQMKSRASFSVSVFQEGKATNTVAGYSTHEGPYLDKDDFTLRVSVPEPSLEDPEVMEMVSYKLTRENFQGFGPELDTLEFKKGDMTFMCRYTREHVMSDLASANRTKIEKNNATTGENKPDTPATVELAQSYALSLQSGGRGQKPNYKVREA